MKPGWIKGDVVAMPQDLQPDQKAITRGCHVFVAEHNPRYENGKWLYGFRDCCELRRATIADVERLIVIAQNAVLREAQELGRLLELRDKIK